MEVGIWLIAGGIAVITLATLTLTPRIFKRNPQAESLWDARDDPLTTVFRICVIIALTLIGIGALIWIAS